MVALVFLAAGIAAGFALWPRDKRARVVAIAKRELGNGDASKYWSVVYPGKFVSSAISWCGGFALWALRMAGLTTANWIMGDGFISPLMLPVTNSPKPGDIAYFTKNQHQAIVEKVEGNNIYLVNGNGDGGKVSPSVVNRSSVAAFYSIEPLL